jgi:hypothetical protein
MAGLASLHAHHHINAWIDFGCIGFIGGVVYFQYRSRQRLNQFRREIAARRAELAGLTEKEQINAIQQAIRNLELVAKVTGASLGGSYTMATIQIGYDVFEIRQNAIYRNGRGACDSTCLNYGEGSAMPIPEQIASTLLLLKNDPTIFDRWKQQDKFYS